MDESRITAHMATHSALNSGLQDRRLLRLDFPRGDGPDAVMLVNTLHAHEEVSRDFRFEVELISHDARISLKAMMAKMVTISMVRANGSLRYFNGYVAEFRLVRSDGGFAFYQMVLEPWLAFLKLRKNCMSFHGRSAIEIVEATFEHYLQRDYRTRLSEGDPKLTCANQYNESDYNHVHRRMEAQGQHYWYEHRVDGHTMVIGDNTLRADSIDPLGGAAYPEHIPFRRNAGSLEDDCIHEWQAVRRVESGSAALASFNYKHPYAHIVSGDSQNRQGNVPAYELYEDAGSYGFKDSRDGELRAQRRIWERDARAQHFEASGNDRVVQAGRCFKLTGHFSGEYRAPQQGVEAKPSITTRDYLILSVDHIASNNYHINGAASSHYENRFLCIRKSIPWWPGRYFNSVPCPNPGVLTAIVVGPPNQAIYTDQYGRVKLQFHWDRIGTYDEASSPWIRVMAPIAGHFLGQLTLPRVKQEVFVSFLSGNIDHPVIVGGLYNNSNMPPWSLPGQRPLMGIRSRELPSIGGEGGGKRSNHLILDDSNGEIQVQIKSDHEHSQLSLGHITRIEGTAGRKDGRGEGFALETGGAGVLRSAKGLLLSTDGRASAVGGMLSRDELVACLEKALDIAKGLGQAASIHQGGQRETGPQQDLTAAIDALGHGAGDEAGASGSAAGGQAVLALSGAAGIASATPQDQTHYAGQNIDTVAGRNEQHYAAQSILLTAGKDIEQFALDGNIRLIANKGKIVQQAQHDSMEITADKSVTIMSCKDHILISAEKHLTLTSGGAYIRLADGNIEIVCPGNLIFKSASRSFTGPSSMAANMPTFDIGDTGRRFLLYRKGDKSNLVANHNYKIELEGGKTVEGKTGADGLTKLAESDAMRIVNITVWEDPA